MTLEELYNLPGGSIVMDGYGDAFQKDCRRYRDVWYRAGFLENYTSADLVNRYSLHTPPVTLLWRYE